MEEQEYQGEEPESPTEGNEDTGEQVVEEAEQVEEGSEPTAPVEKTVPLKAMTEERRKRQAAEQRLAQLEAMQLAVPDEPVIAKPKPDQFNDYDEYVEALADYKARQIFRAEQENSRTLSKAELAKREEAALVQKAQKDAAKAAAKYDDFYDVAGSVQLNDASLKALYQSDIGPEIVYYLGKNEAELERFQDMSPSRQIMELGKLEAKLSAKTANPAAKQVRKATEVENAGNGFNKPKTDITKLLDKAKATGDWTEYLIATGNA